MRNKVASLIPAWENPFKTWHDSVMSTKPIVSIVGGGIAGLAAAIALANKSRPVTIHERATQFEEVGAGLQLGPNAVRALQVIGAWDAVAPITYAPPAILMRNGANGRMIKKIDLLGVERRYGQPYRVAHRADLHGALAEVARAHRNIEIRLGEELDATALKGEVIASDGVRSATRTKLFPGSEAVAVQDVIFRALAPMPASGNGLDCVNLWMFPGGHMVHYPVGQKQKLNLVAVTQGVQPQQHFASAHASLKTVLNFAPSWLAWPGAYVPALCSWQKDSITLIGDAAHGTLPFLAQGAAMALEDVVTLVTDRDWASRQTRTRRLHRETLKAGKAYHVSGPMALARDVMISTLPPAYFLKRLDWIYAAN